MGTSPQNRPLGRSGPVVSAPGLGCAGLSSGYGTSDDDESLATLRRALELGITLFDTADVYGDGHNERLVGRAIAGRRDGVVIATKFGFVRAADTALRIDARPERVREACEASLRRLGVDTIDLYYPHRVDPAVPIEDVVGAMAELVAAGKVRHLGLCEASPRTLRRAAAVHPITALESEWSLWSRDIEADVLDVAGELGIGIVAYCPLGRGYLTGTITSPDALEDRDYRRSSPRFSPENLARNQRMLDGVRGLAHEKGVTPAQLCLAWVLARGAVPIPGTRRVRYLEENTAASAVELSETDMGRLDAVAPAGAAAGGRYSGGISGDSPERLPVG